MNAERARNHAYCDRFPAESKSGTRRRSASTSIEGTPREVERADAEYYFASQLEVIRLLADRIEAQLGYSILEVAGCVVPEPKSLPDSGSEHALDLRSEELRGSGRNRARDCRYARWPTSGTGMPGTATLSAAAPCALVSYHVRVGSAAHGPASARGQRSATSSDHELFHLFGFKSSAIWSMPHDPGAGVRP